MSLTGFPYLEEDLRLAVRQADLDYESFQIPLQPCELNRCKGMCCHDGVFIGAEEQAVIAAVVEPAESREIYFEEREGRVKTRTIKVGEEWHGEGYPAHFPSTRCVFLDDQHHCYLQSQAMAEGCHEWFWKPFPCWLHPISLRKREAGARRYILSLPSLADDPASAQEYPGFASCTTCGKRERQGDPAWMVLRKELEFLGLIAGRDLIAELRSE